MKISDSDIERQLRLGEDSSWEFKQIEFSGHRPRSPSRDQLADEIAAFANTEGGVLLCGVTDAGEVQGMSREQMDALESLLVEICTDAIKPPLNPFITRRELDERSPFLLVEVPRGHALHESPGGSYRRIGSSKRRMTTDERLRFAPLRAQASFLWLDKQPIPDTGFATLDRELWLPLLSAEGAADPQTALRQLRLLANDHAGVLRATVTGVLLCTRNPHDWLPQATISAARYGGTDRASGQLDASEITGPLHRQIADAMHFVRRNMRVAARKTPARVDMPEYSLRAVFEAVVNAVAHRDYAMRERRIRLSMFADRLEVESPGELPNGMTIDAMPSSQATRNEALASMLGRMPVGGIQGSEERRYFMERRGDGVRIILRETRELCGRDPEYRMLDGKALRLIVPAASHRTNPASVTIKVLADGQPLSAAKVLVLYPDKTWREATTGYDGEGCVDLYTTELPMRVFVAATGYAAHCEEGWIPAEGDLTVELDLLPEGGAVILSNATGRIPGLSGRLNPIRDTSDRTYLHADDMSINEGRQQPVSFLFGEELRLTDAFGHERRIRIVDITGRSALVEYRAERSQEGGS